MTASVNVQRGVVDADEGTATTSVAPPVDFGDIDKAFAYLTNNRRMNAGLSSLAATNLDIVELSGGVEVTAVDSLDIGKLTGGNTVGDYRFAWESLEYGGPDGGPNEFIVRGRYRLTLTGATITQAVPGVVNDNDVIPHITGLMCTSTADDASHATAIAWMDGAGTLNVKRGGGSNDTVYVWVTVVEYVGSAFSVKHGRVMSNADIGTITLVDNADGTTAGGGDVGDWATALIVHQFVGNALDGVDDAISDTSATYIPGGGVTTEVDWQFNSNHVDDAGAGLQSEHMVHVLQHDDLNVTRYLNTSNVAGANNVDITSAGLTDIGQATVEVSRSSSGAGTAYARGWVNARLTSLTNVELWVHRSGNTISTQLQIADWSGLQDLAAFNAEVFDGVGWVSATVEVFDGAGWAPATPELVT